MRALNDMLRMGHIININNRNEEKNIVADGHYEYGGRWTNAYESC